jgi:hypothetical protein
VPVDENWAENKQTEPAPLTGSDVLLGAASILEMLGRQAAADAVRAAGNNPEPPEDTEEPYHDGGPLEGGGRWEYWQQGSWWWYGEFDAEENLVYEATGDMANKTVTQIIYEAQQEVADAEESAENGTGIAEEANGVGNEEDGKQIDFRDALAELPDEALDQMIRDKLPGAYADEVLKQASREQKIKLLWKLNQGWKITYRDSENSDEDYEVVGNVIRIQTQKYRSFSEYGVHGPSSRRTWRHIGSKSNEEIAAALLASLDDKYVQNAGGYRGRTLENPAEVGWNDFVENPRTKGAVAFVRIVGGVATIVSSGGATLPLVIGTYETFRGTDDGVKVVAEEITGEEYRGVAESGLDAATGDQETSNKILFWLDSGVMIVELGNGARMAFRKAKPGKSLSSDGPPVQSTLRKNSQNVDPTNFTNAEKGNLAELRTAQTMRRAGYEELPSKLPGNQGFDGVWVKKNAEGEITEIVITESKFQKGGGKPRLKQTETMGQQMSDQWIKANIQRMIASGDPSLVRAGNLLQANFSLIKKKGAVLDPLGRLHYYTINYYTIK